jgi:micrococcal nuclease
LKSLIYTIPLLLATLQPAMAEDLVGHASGIRSGELFSLCDRGKCTRIRLCGIATPSNGTAEANASLFALHKLIYLKRVRCKPVGQGSVCDGHTDPQSSRRTLAQCFLVGTDIDIAARLVAGAFACDRVRRSGGAYSKTDPGAKCNPP